MRFLKAIALLFFIFIVSNIQASYPSRFEGYFKDYGKHPLDLIANFIPNNPTIFEAGGHYGDHTVKFVERWPQSTIYSFEPNPHAFEILSSKVKGLDNVKLQNLAVADFNGKAIFYLCYGSNGNEPIYEGASSLLPPSDYMKQHYQGPQIEVNCVVLDDWSRANGVTGFDFMWLDMEGYELQALSSSPEILATVKAIYVETNFQNFRLGMTQFTDLKNFLERNGFKLLSHWYAEGLQGNAIFVRSALFSLKNKIH